MKKRFLGMICLLYSGMIIYVWLFDKLKNILAPQMQIYLKLSLIPMIIIGLVMLLNDKVHYKFKISDLVLLLPLVAIIFAGDGRLTTSLANNRSNTFIHQAKKGNSAKDNIKKETDNDAEINKDDETEDIEYDFSTVDYDVVDESYDMLANNLTYSQNPDYYIGKKIRVRGFSMKSGIAGLPNGYFALGKYSISCCVADAGFAGFIAKYDTSKIESNSWYEIEGILKKSKDTQGYDIVYIDVINLKEIDEKSEEQYVYPCYSYGDGSCSFMDNYDIYN